MSKVEIFLVGLVSLQEKDVSGEDMKKDESTYCSPPVEEQEQRHVVGDG